MKLRRMFLASISWPAIELTLALTVVGVVIWLMGAIPALKKSGIDILGFGLSGNSGLVTYLTFLGDRGRRSVLCGPARRCAGRCGWPRSSGF